MPAAAVSVAPDMMLDGTVTVDLVATGWCAYVGAGAPEL